MSGPVRFVIVVVPSGQDSMTTEDAERKAQYIESLLRSGLHDPGLVAKAAGFGGIEEPPPPMEVHIHNGTEHTH